MTYGDVTSAIFNRDADESGEMGVRMTAQQDAMHVFTWVDPNTDVMETPKTLPCRRVWGDVILQLISERRGLVLEPPLGIRSSAIFAWLRPRPPAAAASSTAGRVVVELEVEPSACAAARWDLRPTTHDALAWRRLREHLVDEGIDADQADEELTPMTSPLAAMKVDGARPVVESTDKALLTVVIDYFAPGSDPYLRSWRSLTEIEPSDAEDWEVVVPRIAIRAVHP